MIDSTTKPSPSHSLIRKENRAYKNVVPANSGNVSSHFLKYGRTDLSHIVQIQTQVRDATAVDAACRRLGLPPPVQRTAKLFSSTATGLTVQLPGWSYPVVFDVATGDVKFDNFNGRWKGQS
jgi:hypothetical protein